MIKYVYGNVVEAEQPIIMHGCNAQGKMNSGVAKAVREKWPQAYLAYDECIRNGKLVLGTNQYVMVETGKWVVNAITQDRYGYDGARYVSYDAIDACMGLLADYLRKSHFDVAMPKIGAGRGGGSWQVIERIINDRLRHHHIYVYEMEEPDARS